jgi:hypothetical protein
MSSPNESEGCRRLAVGAVLLAAVITLVLLAGRALIR